MNLRIVGRPNAEHRIVDLDGPEPMDADDTILGPDGQPLGHEDLRPLDPVATFDELDREAWTEIVARDLAGLTTRETACLTAAKIVRMLSRAAKRPAA